MPEKRDEAARPELRVTADEARRIAALLRYAVSLNTTAGLVAPTQRRLTTPTYRAAELAALVLEGHTFDEALQLASKAWTGVLERDHLHALEVLQRERVPLLEAMSSYLTPAQLVEYLEIAQDHYLELIRASLQANPEEPQK